MSKVKVTAVGTVGYGAEVQFADGHRAVFEAYAHGAFYSIEGLQGWDLYKDGHKVFAYSSRLYRVGPQPDEHKITLMASGYTQQSVAQYWRAAVDYLNREYLNSPNQPKDLWWPWRVIAGEGWMDLQALENGTAQVLSK